jgi:hypothetical protein
MKNYLVAWLSGFAVALLMTERWRRMGSSAFVPAAVSEGEPGEEPSPRLTTRARTVASTASRAVAVGARSDLDRIGRLAARLKPGHHVDEPPTADQSESSDVDVQRGAAEGEDPTTEQ